MKILITGGSGSLGQYLNLSLAKDYNILTLYNYNIGNCYNFNSKKINLLNNDDVYKIFKEYNPDIVVHCAAISSALLDGKYSLKDYYYNNVLVTKNIGELCKQYNVRMIYISTDLVYDGNRGSYLSENSKLNPISPYAESKLMGEEKVKEFLDNFIIIRIALLIGFGLNHSTSHFQQLYENLLDNKPTKLFYDQFRSPISYKEASRAIKKIIDYKIESGIYNLGGNERLSRYDLGVILANYIKADKQLLIGASIDEVPMVPKVRDVSISIKKLNNYGITINSIDKMISEMF